MTEYQTTKWSLLLLRTGNLLSWPHRNSHVNNYCSSNIHDNHTAPRFLDLEDGSDRLFRNVGKELPLFAAWYPMKKQLSVPNLLWIFLPSISLWLTERQDMHVELLHGNLYVGCQVEDCEWGLDLTEKWWKVNGSRTGLCLVAGFPLKYIFMLFYQGAWLTQFSSQSDIWKRQE